MADSNDLTATDLATGLPYFGFGYPTYGQLWPCANPRFNIEQITTPLGRYFGASKMKYSETIGNNKDLSFVINHGFGMNDYLVELWPLSGEMPSFTLAQTDTDNLTVTFDSAPDSVRVVVLG